MTEQNALEHTLQDHAARYPQMQVQDMYKLLHQAAMGSGHAIQNPQAARKWLENETASLGEGPDEPLPDPISPEGVARIHLRPYIRSGADLGALFEAFLRTADQFKGHPERLTAGGDLAVNLAKAGMLPFDPTEIEQFWSRMAGQGYPAAHHSKVYAAAYRPAYRVILLDLLYRKRGT